MARNFDLLGDPIPENFGKPGANGHVPTRENAKKIRAYLLAGMTVEQIAHEIGISAPTLRKHYFRNGKINYKQARGLARAELEAKRILRLDEQVDSGSVSAIKEMGRIIEREAVREMPELPKAATPKGPEGKKAAKKSRARDVPSGLAGLIPGETGPH